VSRGRPGVASVALVVLGAAWLVAEPSASEPGAVVTLMGWWLAVAPLPEFDGPDDRTLLRPARRRKR
jgi:hypothetical protein